MDVIDISGSSCSKYILEQHGLSVSKLCIDGQSTYVCNDNTSSYGAKMPENFYSNLNINKSDILNSISTICIKNIASAAVGMASNCDLSDHELFEPLTSISVRDPHSCFCKQNDELVLSLCHQINGKWLSSAEFDTDHVKNKLSIICEEKKSASYKIACFCKKHFQADNRKYIECLKEHTKAKGLDFSPQKNDPKGVR